MRTGLVAVGVGFLVLAAGALITVNTLPRGTQVQDSFTVATSSVDPHGTGAALVTGTNVSSGRLAMQWTVSASMNVSLYEAPDCRSVTAACASGVPRFSWNGTGADQWSASGSFTFPYVVVWHSRSNSTSTFSASGVESWTASASVDLVSMLFVDGVAIALGAVGAVATFLGLFLRQGVYRGPAPVVSRSADDLDDLVGRRPPAR